MALHVAKVVEKDGFAFGREEQGRNRFGKEFSAYPDSVGLNGDLP